MERTILHSDLNNFYASVECLYQPKLRNKAVAVCGDPEARHRIVLAKNQVAKKFGVSASISNVNLPHPKNPIIFLREYQGINPKLR